MTHEKKLYLCENQNKIRQDWREKREKRYMIGLQFILKKSSIENVMFMSSVYMKFFFCEECLYEVVSIEATSSILGWNWP